MPIRIRPAIQAVFGTWFFTHICHKIGKRFTPTSTKANAASAAPRQCLMTADRRLLATFAVLAIAVLAAAESAGTRGRAPRKLDRFSPASTSTFVGASQPESFAS